MTNQIFFRFCKMNSDMGFGSLQVVLLKIFFPICANYTLPGARAHHYHSAGSHSMLRRMPAMQLSGIPPVPAVEQNLHISSAR